MYFPASALSLLATLPLGVAAQEPEAPAVHFPTSKALAEGVSPQALDHLDELVLSFVVDEEIVGAELLVIKNGRSILHKAYGLSDVETQAPMRTGSVFCVRSMTKPLIGTSILMLIDDNVIEFDDPISKFLPAFDVDGKRTITVEHLLSHTSGLPMSMIATTNPRELESIQAVAALGGGAELEFEPGTGFHYSDQGTDTLTALIEIVTGAPAEDFVRERLLDPLGMGDSTCLMGEDHPLRARAISKYAGSNGTWTRFWSPEDEALFPIFLGSQGLYSTLEDYGRFMEFWMNKGRVNGKRKLAARYTRKALTPNPHGFPGGTGLPGLVADYGYLMQLWMGPGKEGKDGEIGDPVVTAFGHTGSDGTHAWVFPKEKAMVLYFTQSRNNTTGLQVEEALGEMFLGVPFDPNMAAPPLEQYLGYYWEGGDDLYRAIILDDGKLTLEVRGRAIAPLAYVGEDRWKIKRQPGTVLEFRRSESGEVIGYHIGEHQEVRLTPSADLPTAAEVAALVAKAHRLDLIESLGTIRMDGELTIEKAGVTGKLTTWLGWPSQFRIDAQAAGMTEHIAYNGERVRYESSTVPLTTLEGVRAETIRLGSTFAHFGDLLAWHPGLRVVQQVEDKGRKILIVRTGDTSAPATTLFIHADSGTVRRAETVGFMEGLGRVGMKISFGDFRDVSGMLLPFRTEIEVANQFIGTIVTTVTGIEVGVTDLPEGGFDLNTNSDSLPPRADK